MKRKWYAIESGVDGINKARVVVQVRHDDQGIVAKKVGIGGKLRVQIALGPPRLTVNLQEPRMIRQQDARHRHLEQAQRQAHDAPERPGA